MIHDRGLRLVPDETLQQAQLHQRLRESQVAMAKLATRLLDELMASVPDSMTSVLVDLDEAIARVDRARERLAG